MTMAPPSQPPILITGLSGNLGRHLAPYLKDFPLIGADLYGPHLDHPQVEFHTFDLAAPEAVTALQTILLDSGARQVVHLAFVLDPARTGAISRERQRQINVQGTAHLLDAIEGANRSGCRVEHLMYLSSVTSYGPNLPGPVNEDHPQNPHTYTYALHKKETEELLRARLPRLNGCGLTIVRGHIFLGPDVENFIVTALRGQANPNTRLGRWVRRRGWRLPLLLPRGQENDGLYQFMHIEDAARVMAWLCRHYQRGEFRILNAQGRGEPVTGAGIAEIAGVPLWRLPSRTFVRWVYWLVWATGLSAIPPESFPYFAGSYTMNTERLEELLGSDYPSLVRHTTRDALDSIKEI